MEESNQGHLMKEMGDCYEDLPPLLIQAISAHELTGFDSVMENDGTMSDRLESSGFGPPRASAFGIESAAMEVQSNPSKLKAGRNSVSISMPPSPIGGDHSDRTRKVLFRDDPTAALPGIEILNSDDLGDHSRRTRFYSQPMMPNGSTLAEPVAGGGKPPESSDKNPAVERPKDKRFDSFKTWSGRLERQISQLRGKHTENGEEDPTERRGNVENVPVDRYFDALEGPELDTLRASEEILLPKDEKWPFLLRFPVSSFGICLGMSSQAIMWKALATSASTKYLNVSPHVNLVLWFTSVALLAVVAFIYSLKITFYFEAVRREYHHPVRVNFFFAPWIALLFLSLGIPPSLAHTLHASIWYILMAPILCLELKIYGQWMSGGQRRLSKVANPSNHLSIIGNFLGALLGATMGLEEGPIFFFAVGLAHYIVLFVTLYQRLPTNATLPRELHPVFFLFVAAPSVASMAWARITGSFDYGSKTAYFIALFLYFSLVVRINFFRGFRFSLAWWAYTFPMTGAAVATIRYSNAVTNTVTKCLTIILCIIATLTVAGLLVTTLAHAFVMRDLFPNDIAIAISERKRKTTRKWYHRRSGSTDSVIDQYLKYVNSDKDDTKDASSANLPV